VAQRQEIADRAGRICALADRRRHDDLAQAISLQPDTQLLTSRGIVYRQTVNMSLRCRFRRCTGSILTM
jgi:hypothetical protein